MAIRRFLQPLFAVSLLAFSGAAQAHHGEAPVQANLLAFSHAWFPVVDKVAHAAPAYLTIVNSGAEPDRLIAVSSPFATITSFRASTISNDGNYAVTIIDAIMIPAQGNIILGPAGPHIMMEGLSPDRKPTEEIPLLLTFEKAGTVEIHLEPKQVHAMGAPGS